jgi:hypothetical protein
MTKETSTPKKGRPVTNKVDQLPAPPKDIAKAIFKSADKKIKKIKKKPN